MANKKIIIIGGGSSALIAADFLGQICDVEIYEKEKNIGQKFLVAGKGGFNLTNSLTGIDLAKKYSPKLFLHNSIIKFDSISVREWLRKVGVETYTGTSGRVYAKKQHRPIEVLDNIKKSIIKKNVRIFTNHHFNDFDKNNRPIIRNNEQEFSAIADYYIFALGGASWSITGSDGTWTKLFSKIGISTLPFQASNCGVNINWPKSFSLHHIGKPLKNICITLGDKISTGEAVITKYGLEGNAIYSIVPEIRNMLGKEKVKINIDLKPNNTCSELLSKLGNQKVTAENYKKLLNLNAQHFSLLKTFTTKDDFLNSKIFVEKIKKLPIPIESLRPIEEAISTVGGIDINELSPDLSLKQNPNFFTIGEMVNWDAPTGGFLLQGCFSMGAHAARSILDKLD